MNFIFTLVSCLFTLSVTLGLVVAVLYALYMGNEYAKMHTVLDLMAEVFSIFTMEQKTAKRIALRAFRVFVLVVPALGIKVLRKCATWAISAGAALCVVLFDALSLSPAENDG